LIFIFDRSSVIHRLIRKIDHSMWAHVGWINKNKEIDEITTTGRVISPFSSLYKSNIVVGLYRFKNRKELTTETIELIQDVLNERSRITGYNWLGVFVKYLQKRWGIPFKVGTSPGDLMRMNLLELIAYA